MEEKSVTDQMPPPMAMANFDDNLEKQEQTTETENCVDAVDGIFTIGRKGHYRPKVEEMESWGGPLDRLSQQDENASYLLALLRVDTKYRWRSGLIDLLRMCRDGEECHKALIFLNSLVSEGANAAEKGAGENVDFNPNEAPDILSCANCLNIIHGLNFITTSPGTVRDLNYVDIQTGVNTDQKVLKGFGYLLKCIECISWENLGDVLALAQDKGLQLYHTICHLNSGYGLEHESRNMLEALHKECPGLLTELGFRDIQGNSAKWQKPKNTRTFENVLTMLFMFYTSADNIQTAV